MLQAGQLYRAVAVALNLGVIGNLVPLGATMKSPRGGHTATLLANGQVLLAGGFFNSSTSLDSAELYNPTAQTFTLVSGSMTSHRASHQAVTLPNGQVMLIGGANLHIESTSTEFFNPATQTFTTSTAVLTTARGGLAATSLANGQVLVVGGASSFSPATLTSLNTAEIYNPTANSFTALTATMVTSRATHTATLLSNGTVLIIGGATGTSSLPTILDTV